MSAPRSPTATPAPDAGDARLHAAPGVRRVLIVEDSATQAAALAALLEEHGYATVTARDGEEALARVADTPVDLVLSDVVMPGLSGYDVCRRIKTELGRRDLPVVLLTGLSDPMDIIRGLESGADNYITKPYERTHLLSRVRQVLDNRDMRRQAAAGEGVEITFLGARFNITADKEQILDLLVSSYEELVRTNQAVRQAEQRSRFLAEATGILAASLDAETVLGNLTRFAVPTMADVCAADLVDEDGRVRRVEVAAASPALAAAAEALRAHTPTAGGPGLVGHVLRQRLPVLLPDVPAEVLQALAPGADALRDPQAAGLRSLLVVPLVARGHTLGALLLLGGATRRRYGPEDLALAQELARQAALAVDNARLYHAAQQATRARDDVLAIVSHDLRNPIHAIYMAASFLLDVLPDDPADADAALSRRQAAVIRRGAQRANALISDLLDVTRIEAGRLTVSTAPVDAAELVNDAVHDATPLAEDKSQRLTTHYGERLPKVRADRGRIAQLFGNLLGNAIKFTPTGGEVTVRAQVEDGMVRFTVVDSGPGIAPDDLPHLFDRYWQARDTADLGTGLGLFIARGIAEAHGGRIWAESTPGAGAAFHFTLPVE
ncbi:MAG TPA: hybrid sensor histidine kinase/response regulator [Gemmatimonadaceae bacterium]|nr:hybrid sensor histidine kinase/response regulator [Gemmatimonadaceae bacterium]